MILPAKRSFRWRSTTTAAASGRGTSSRRRAKVGLVNLNIPEEYGGVGASVLEECIVGEELAYGCSGIQTALMLNQLAVLPMLIAANEKQKEKYFTSLTQEGKIMAYCMTEPDAGSDVAGIKTTAIRKGDQVHPQRRQDLDHRWSRRLLLHGLCQD